MTIHDDKEKLGDPVGVESTIAIDVARSLNTMEEPKCADHHRVFLTTSTRGRKAKSSREERDLRGDCRTGGRKRKGRRSPSEPLESAVREIAIAIGRSIAPDPNARKAIPK